MSTLTTAPAITYRLPYDRETRDHNCLVTIGDDPEQYIGSAETYLEAERKCRNYINDLLASDLFQSATALDGGSDPDAIAGEYAEALESDTPILNYKRRQEALDRTFAQIQQADDPGHDIALPDLAECPDISAPQPVEELSACERYSTPPGLALWGPGTPECSRCGTRHDPVVGCPKQPAKPAKPARPAKLGSPIEDCLCPRCTNCDKPHHIQRCPEVWRALVG